jgi:lipopolysaccharide transport system permease protein
MSKRELKDRYVGQFLGVFWAVLNPLVTMFVYLFIFVLVFRMRMPETSGGAITSGWGGSYAMYLLSGLLPWIALQEVMQKGVVAVTSNANLVKQVIFPVEILPLKILWAALLSQLISLGVLLLYGIIRFGLPSPLILFVPLLLFTQLVFSGGIVLLFSAITPFLRDFKDMVGLFCFVLVYTMPIFYTQDMLPPVVRFVLRFNPLLHMIECWHDVLYRGAFLSPWSWLVFPLFSVVVFVLGCRVFANLKPLFGNVL